MIRAHFIWLFLGLAMGACGSEQRVRVLVRDASVDGGRVDAGADIEEDAEGPVPQADAGQDAALATVCGDYVVEVGEECDDGNALSNDGCSARCEREVRGEADVCPGKTWTLLPVGDGSFTGAFEVRSDDQLHQYDGFCGGSGPEAVVQIIPTVTGMLEITASADHDLVLYARSECEVKESEAVCEDKTPAGQPETMALEVQAGSPVFLFVDGLALTAGRVLLEAVQYPVTCNNGVLEGLETCEDGNRLPGDGCDELCRLEKPSLDYCPGNPLRMWSSESGPLVTTVRGSTNGRAMLHHPRVCRERGAEYVYGITADRAGSLTARITQSSGSHLIYVRSLCGERNTQLGCGEPGPDGQPLAEVEVPIRAEEQLYVIVDTLWSSGTFDVAYTLTPAACGNGKVDPDEGCDDGNEIDDDGCSDCQFDDSLPQYDVCPGGAVAFTPIADGAWAAERTLSTENMVGNSEGQTVQLCAARAAADAIIRFTAPTSGRLRIDVDAEFDATLQFRSVCNIEQQLPGLPTFEERQALRATELFCQDTVTGGGTEIAQGIPIVEGNTYFVIVDSATSGEEGPFHIRLTAVKGGCANSLKEGGEECDDGNLEPGDGCGADCQLEDPGVEDACPGQLREITMGAQQALRVGLVNQAADFELRGGTCAEARGHDVVVQVTPKASGLLKVTGKAQAADLVLAVREHCEDELSERQCRNRSGTSELEQIIYPVRADVPVYVIAKAMVAGQSAPVDLTFELKESACGDGFLGVDEICDDGNFAAGDGCAANCTLELPAASDTCPGQALELSKIDGVYRAVFSGNTDGFGSNVSEFCGGGGRDAIYRFEPEVTGPMRIRVQADFQAVVYARTVCESVEGWSVCTDDASNEYDLTSPARDDSPLWIVIDAEGTQSGSYQVEVSLEESQ